MSFRISLKSRSKLREFGLKATLGQVAAVPSGPCQSQFGPEGKRIWELVRGIDNTHLYPRYMEENINENAALPSVTVSLDVIIVSIESLLARLFDGNTFKGKGIRSLRSGRAHGMQNTGKRSLTSKSRRWMSGALSHASNALWRNTPAGPVEQAGLRITGLATARRAEEPLPATSAKEHLAEDINNWNSNWAIPRSTL